mgnify:FL=1|tara:strand:+ start:3613 stop:3852 length:240 start_codon:yes stop_codon:yes gene_type:complete
MERIKLIWDFKGPNALPIAQHHVTHLKEFIQVEGLENSFCETETISSNHCIAFMVVNKEQMDSLRERLKPNRGQIFTEE